MGKASSTTKTACRASTLALRLARSRHKFDLTRPRHSRAGALCREQWRGTTRGLPQRFPGTPNKDPLLEALVVKKSGASLSTSCEFSLKCARMSHRDRLRGFLG